MRQVYKLILFIVLSAGMPQYLLAQNTGGAVFDADTKNPVSYVTVSNKRTKASAFTDVRGQFNMDMRAGDTLLFAHPGYTFSQKVVTGTSMRTWHYIEQKKIALDEVEILSDMAKFQRDSAERRVVYRKVLNDAGHAPGANFNGGVGVDGLFTSLAYWISGKGKRNKNFVKTMLRNEENKFVTIRYSVLLVRQQTGLSEENAITFIQQNPMPYDYARTATDLEMKMWIREKYREWSKSTGITGTPADTTGSKQ